MFLFGHTVSQGPCGLCGVKIGPHHLLRFGGKVVHKVGVGEHGHPSIAPVGAVGAREETGRVTGAIHVRLPKLVPGDGLDFRQQVVALVKGAVLNVRAHAVVVDNEDVQEGELE